MDDFKSTVESAMVNILIVMLTLLVCHIHQWIEVGKLYKENDNSYLNDCFA